GPGQPSGTPYDPTGSPRYAMLATQPAGCSVRAPGHRRPRPKENAMIVADVSFADIFWSLLWFYFLFLWIMVLFHILGDLFRDHTLSAVTKTLWVLFLVFLPF